MPPSHPIKRATVLLKGGHTRSRNPPPATATPTPTPAGTASRPGSSSTRLPVRAIQLCDPASTISTASTQPRTACSVLTRNGSFLHPPTSQRQRPCPYETASSQPPVIHVADEELRIPLLRPLTGRSGVALSDAGVRPPTPALRVGVSVSSVPRPMGPTLEWAGPGCEASPAPGKAGSSPGRGGPITPLETTR